PTRTPPLRLTPALFSTYRHPPLPPLHPFPTRRSSDLALRGPDQKPKGPRRENSSCARKDSCARKTAALRQTAVGAGRPPPQVGRDRKSTRLNSSHVSISYAVFCLKKKKRSVQGGIQCE